MKLDTFLLDIKAFFQDYYIGSKVEKLYPKYISRVLNIPLTDTVITLNKLIENNYVVLKFEVHCPNCKNNTVIKTIEQSELNEKIGTIIDCSKCKNTVTIKESNTYPVYFISENFKNYLNNVRRKA